MMRYLLSVVFIFSCFASKAQQANNYQLVSDSVRFNGDNGISFKGIFSKPVGLKKFPTLVIISGTGKQDMNGTMAGHSIFLEIADYLNRNGIGVLRTDDRGTGGTSGVYETSTTADFAADALAAIRFLKTRNDLDTARIGLLGHSEGGAVISIAAGMSKDVKFLISVAGLAMSGLDAQIRQNEDLVAASAMPDHDKKRSNEINRIMFTTAFKYAQSDSMELKLNESYQNWKIKDDAYFKTLNIKFDHFRFPVYSYVKNSIGPWYRYFIQYNAQKTISKIRVPILAINGDRDLMVAADENLANWKRFALQGGNNSVNTVKLSGLNHLMQKCETCDALEMGKLKGGFAISALEVIKNWVNKINAEL